MESGPTEPIATPVPGLLLRHAAPRDAPQVVAFIRALAEYERLDHEMVADEADIAAALDGPRRVIDVVLAELDGRPAGFALYYYSFSTFVGRRGIYLEDLFVLPELRRRGIGRALLVYLAQLAEARGCGRLEWSVLDWNEPSIAFYRSLGAVGLDDWTVHRVAGEALTRLATSMRLG